MTQNLQPESPEQGQHAEQQAKRSPHLTPERIREKIYSIIQLPALPAVAMEVVDLVDNPHTSASTLARVISTDQALTAKLLKIANSPFYGFPKKISTVDFAIIVLGFDALKEIVISISLISSLQKKSDGVFNAQKFWDHSIATGVVARRLARDFGYRVSGEVFVSGLLHDMGISVMHRFFQNDYMRVVDIVRTSNLTHLEAEDVVFGVSHAQIGGWLAERWNLPEHLADAITWHHDPLQSKANSDLVAIIHLADVIVNKITPQAIWHDFGIEFDAGALERFHLSDPSVLEELLNEYREKIAEDIAMATAISPVSRR